MKCLPVKRASRFVLLCSLIVSAMPLAGCWNRTEVNDLALVTGAAVDRIDEKSIELSVQVFIPRAGGGGQQGMGGGGGGGGDGSRGGGGGGGAQTLVRSARGTTIADAMSQLQEKLPRKIFWGHTEVFVIGEKMAKQGIRDLVDFIMRYPQTRERAAMFVSKGEARKALEYNPHLERATSEVLREMSKSKLSMDVDAKELAQMLSGDARAAALPWVEMMEPHQDSPMEAFIPYVHGTAVFRKDKMVGQLDDNVTRGVLWVRDEIVSEAVITVTPKEAEGYVSFSLEHSHTIAIPEIRNNDWSITVRIETDEDVIQNTTGLDVMSPQISESLQRQLEEDIRHRAQLACTRAKKLRADIFDFAEAFHRKYPKQWNKVKDHWDDKFAELEIKIETKAKIRRPGATTTGGNRPNEEVEKQ